MKIKHVLCLQTDAGQKLVLLFDPSSQTLVSGPDEGTTTKKKNTLVSVTQPPFSSMSAFLYLVGNVCIENVHQSASNRHKDHKNKRKVQVHTKSAHLNKAQHEDVTRSQGEEIKITCFQSL